MTNGFVLPPLPSAPRVRWDDVRVRNARLSADAPRVPFDVFMRRELQWNQGEHFALIGPTGQGKTTMQIALLPVHPYVTVFATKPKDPTMDALIRTGYMRIPYWRKLQPDTVPRRVLWPDASELNSTETQREVFSDALERIYREGGWTVAVDELWYFTAVLGLDHAIRVFLLQGRSLGISLLSATQRPARVPVEVYDQSTHLMFWRDNDRRNLDRISEINARDAALVRTIVQSLDRYQVLYINTRTGKMLRTHVPLNGG